MICVWHGTTSGRRAVTLLRMCYFCINLFLVVLPRISDERMIVCVYDFLGVLIKSSELRLAA